MTNGSEGGANAYSNTNGHVSRTPSLSGLSLTEYSANPTPLSETSSASRIAEIIPPEFILPNGHPDVGLPRHTLLFPLTITAS